MVRAAAAVAVLACACGAPSGLHPSAEAPIGPNLAGRPAGAEKSDEPSGRADSTPSPPPAAESPCDDTLAGALARVSCDGTRFVVAHPIELHPDRPVPVEPTRGVLHAVSDILRESPDILFVRIEVSVGADVGQDPEKRRTALAAAQRRAGALLQYLWRKRGISAERLEAVAYEHDARRARSDTPWPVVLRIVQRAKR